MRPPRLSSLAVIAGVVALAACSDATAPTSPLAADGVRLSGVSGGGGTTTTTVDPYSILPTTAPAPDILMRESFGAGPNVQRPTGGKGTFKDSYAHTPIQGFWLEYPGNKSTQWIAPAEGQTWRFCGGSDNPYELPSPLQQPYGGCVASEWRDAPTTFPTALMPITVALPNEGYELSMEGYPAPTDNGYIAIGFTSSGATYSNLTSSGALWLRVTDPSHFSYPLHWELRTGSLASGQVLATGDFGFSGWNHMALRYSPAASTVTLTFADSVVGTFPVTMAPPKYVAFEGLGILDNLVLRK